MCTAKSAAKARVLAGHGRNHWHPVGTIVTVVSMGQFTCTTRGRCEKPGAAPTESVQLVDLKDLELLA